MSSFNLNDSKCLDKYKSYIIDDFILVVRGSWMARWVHKATVTQAWLLSKADDDFISA